MNTNEYKLILSHFKHKLWLNKKYIINQLDIDMNDKDWEDMKKIRKLYKNLPENK